jgi:hypothetical protein
MSGPADALQSERLFGGRLATHAIHLAGPAQARLDLAGLGWEVDWEAVYWQPRKAGGSIWEGPRTAYA